MSNISSSLVYRKGFEFSTLLSKLAFISLLTISSYSAFADSESKDISGSRMMIRVATTFGSSSVTNVLDGANPDYSVANYDSFTPTNYGMGLGGTEVPNYDINIGSRHFFSSGSGFALSLRSLSISSQDGSSDSGLFINGLTPAMFGSIKLSDNFSFEGSVGITVGAIMGGYSKSLSASAAAEIGSDTIGNSGTFFGALPTATLGFRVGKYISFDVSTMFLVSELISGSSHFNSIMDITDGFGVIQSAGITFYV